MRLVVDQQPLQRARILAWEGEFGYLSFHLIPPTHFTNHLTLYRNLTSAIVTLVVGNEQRLFAAHEDVLCASPFFQNVLRGNFMEAQTKRIALPDEEPEIFSSVLEYLYKGDYYPRLIHNKRRNSYELEQPSEENGGVESTVYHHAIDGDLLKDTVIYCTAEKYGLEDLKRVALRKQGLREFICPSSFSIDERTCADYPKNPGFNAVPSLHLLAMLMPTLLTLIQN
jgi:hypothetical protein